MKEQIILTVLTVIITAVVSSAIAYARTSTGQIKSIKNGMLSLLRAEIIRQHDKWIDREYCPIYAKDAIEKAYIAYHNLGGNGTMTKLYKEIMALHTEPKEKEIKDEND